MSAANVSAADDTDAPATDVSVVDGNTTKDDDASTADDDNDDDRKHADDVSNTDTSYLEHCELTPLVFSSEEDEEANNHHDCALAMDESSCPFPSGKERSFTLSPSHTHRSLRLADIARKGGGGRRPLPGASAKKPRR